MHDVEKEIETYPNSNLTLILSITLILILEAILTNLPLVIDNPQVSSVNAVYIFIYIHTYLRVTDRAKIEPKHGVPLRDLYVTHKHDNTA